MIFKTHIYNDEYVLHDQILQVPARKVISN
jgi:hypothetical protein